MKKVYIILILLGFCKVAISQQTERKEIDSRISKLRIKATKHFKLGEVFQAKNKYNKIVKSSEFNANDIINYALILQELGDYGEANVWFKKFNEINPTDSRGIAYTKNPNAHIELNQENENFEVNSLNINTPNEDFGAVYYKDKVLFTSSRVIEKTINEVWVENSLPFLDVYQADTGKDYSLRKVKPFGEDLNKEYHDGPVSFNKDYTVMYITVDNYSGISKDGIIKLKLFKKNFIDGKWSEKESIAFNSDNYSIGHATTTEDDKWLFFSSSIEGGFGSVDIYKARIYEDGTYGNPINLGENINTEGEEMFPYINKNVLYYSSNGKVGLGGLDIFAVQLEDGMVIGDPINLKVPINSNRDDFSFVLHPEKLGGYISSNRAKGVGNDDIYSFTMKEPLFPKKKDEFWLSVSAYDVETNLQMNDVDIKLVNNKTGEEFNKKLSTEELIVDILDTEIGDAANFEIQFSKEGYLIENFAYNFVYTKDGEYNIREGMKKVAVGVDLRDLIQMNPIYFDLDKSNIRPDAEIELNKIVKVLNENPEMVVELKSHTDCRATIEYNNSLSQRRAVSSATYIQERIPNPKNIYGKGYGESQLVNDCACEGKQTSDCSEEAHQLNRRTEFIIIKVK